MRGGLYYQRCIRLSWEGVMNKDHAHTSVSCCFYSPRITIGSYKENKFVHRIFISENVQREMVSLGDISKTSP